jgi:hypothetical protein
VFVCGEASRMAPEVRQAFIDLFVARTGAAVSNGKTWLAGLIASQRYLEDVWAAATGSTSPAFGSAPVEPAQKRNPELSLAGLHSPSPG